MLNKTLTYIMCGSFGLFHSLYLSGCSDKEAEFSFDESEMLELMETINSKEWPMENNQGSYSLTFMLEQDTSFQGDPNQIDSLSEEQAYTFIFVTGMVFVTEKDDICYVNAENMSLSGEMMVMGLKLDNAELYLSTEDNFTIEFHSEDGRSFQMDSASW